MGVETDFVLATPDQAQAVLASHDPAKEFGEACYAKGTNPISLGALQTILIGGGGSDDFIEDYREIVTEESGEKSVTAVPIALREAIAAHPRWRVPNKSVAKSMMETEDFMLTGWDDQIDSGFHPGHEEPSCERWSR